MENGVSGIFGRLVKILTLEKTATNFTGQTGSKHPRVRHHRISCVKRTCMDCDGDALEQKYCEATGIAVDKNECNHYWGKWTEGLCVTTGCNIVGERVVTRQCLYADEREANKVQLCSKSNESAVMKENCINNTIPNECLPQASPETGNSDNTGFYVGIGVAVALIVILCILLGIVIYRRHKPEDFSRTNISNRDRFPSSWRICEFPQKKAK